jgi:Domain of unknown function (DUF5615)
VTFRLYLDDDSENKALVRALSDRGYDVVRATDVGMRGRPDSEHLEFAAANGRALYTANRGDFLKLDGEWSRAGRLHSGIVILTQQRYSVGEQPPRLEMLLAARTSAEMRGRVFWLSTIE